MDKSLKVGENEWKERERGEQNYDREERENEVWTLMSNFLNDQSCKIHTQGIYL